MRRTTAMSVREMNEIQNGNSCFRTRKMTNSKYKYYNTEQILLL